MAAAATKEGSVSSTDMGDERFVVRGMGVSVEQTDSNANVFHVSGQFEEGSCVTGTGSMKAAGEEYILEFVVAAVFGDAPSAHVW